MPLPVILVLAWVCLAPAPAQEEPRTLPIADLLARNILSEGTVLREVRAFCEARIARMKAFATRPEWEKEAERLRKRVLEDVVFRGEARKWRQADTGVEWLGEIEGGPGYRIRKLRYEVIPGLWVPALLYVPERLEGRVPVVLNPNGHDGKGNAAPYKQIRAINLAKRGMIALNVEWFGMGELRGAGFGHYRANQLDLCGTSGVALHFLSLKRGLDLLLSLESADPERVAVAGLSGGGWQTIFISALDPRVKLANPVAGYSSYLTRVCHVSDLGDSEQTPVDLARTADYIHLTALRAPRPTLLTYNAKDQCCFAAGHALPPLLEGARPIFALYRAEDALRYHVNEDPGTHNFERENREAFYRMLGDWFFPQDATFDAREIPSDGEVKAAEALAVGLPPDNLDFNRIARRLAAELPRGAEPPAEGGELEGWRRGRRELLRRIVSAARYDVIGLAAGTAEVPGGTRASYWKLRIGGEWTVPAVELTRGGEGEAVVVAVGDSGRRELVEDCERFLAQGLRVLALDPFYTGESRIPVRDFLYALLVSSAGERPLGIQASQLAAAARWLQEVRGARVIRLFARGPRMGLAARVAAALEPGLFASVTVEGGLTSLKEPIEKNMGADEAPELFTFGLLEHFELGAVWEAAFGASVRDR